MKTKMMKIISLAMICVTFVTLLAGCSNTEDNTQKYEPDISYETDVEGVYVERLTKSVSYEFYSDGTVESLFSRDEPYIVEPFDNKISKIGFTRYDGSWYYYYKYKNIISLDLWKGEKLPKSKTFDYMTYWLNNRAGDGYFIFSKNGYFHLCLDGENCNHDKDNYEYKHKYIRKNNMIYVYYPDAQKISGNDYDWYILFYIVGDYLIRPDIIKLKDE